ncbi:MAG: hypothetical protein ABR497_08840 [Kiritimatiellia bacterium]|nr:hypothetical protein [Lentisphaerota bacterium]
MKIQTDVKNEESSAVLSISPNQYKGSDIERIQAAINAANGTTNKIVIPERNANGTYFWSVDRAILLPSNMTVVLDNCNIKLSDKCRDNMFRSNNVGLGIKEPVWNHNICIIGVGDVNLYGADNPRATGDGTKELSLTPDEDRKKRGIYGISYGTDAGKEGEQQTSDWRNIMILMAYVKRFYLKNVNIHYPHSWAVSFERTWNADIANIRFNNPGTRIINGQNRRILNQDGIDLRQGCKNFRIDNISGHIEEDCIALSSLDCGEDSPHMITPAKWYGSEDDTEQIFITNIKTGISGVAIRGTEKASIHNVYINGLTTELTRGVFMQEAYPTIYIGTGGYGKLSERGTIRDIFAMNISGAGTSLIHIDAPVENCCFMNGILRSDGEIINYTDRVKGKSKNVVLKNMIKCPETVTRFDKTWCFFPEMVAENKTKGART